MNESKQEKDEAKSDKPQTKRKYVRRLLLAGVAVIGLLVGSVAYIYAVSPAVVRNPQMEHYHFRMQLVVDGKAVDFGGEHYQTPYEKDQCSGELTEQPIHFHDQKDQFVHIHWSGMTGGLVLKNYGWNLVGGSGGLLGYRLDALPKVKAVPIHGTYLPALPDKPTFWIYTGDEHGYKARSFDAFKTQDLEQFFGKKSNFMTYQKEDSLLGWLFPKASAHGSEVHSETEATVDADEQARLTRINNLIGNVVIFVQSNEPSGQQVKDRFAHLVPLSDSTCGG